MNRVFLSAMAAFVALVAVALIGGESNTAVAGHGCNGCAGCYADCSSACTGCYTDCAAGCYDSCAASCACSCSGRQGLFARLKARHAAKKACSGCSVTPDCCVTPCSGYGCATTYGGCAAGTVVPTETYPMEGEVVPMESMPMESEIDPDSIEEAPAAPTEEALEGTSASRKAGFGFRAVSFRR